MKILSPHSFFSNDYNHYLFKHASYYFSYSISLIQYEGYGQINNKQLQSNVSIIIPLEGQNLKQTIPGQYSRILDFHMAVKYL